MGGKRGNRMVDARDGRKQKEVKKKEGGEGREKGREGRRKGEGDRRKE